MLGRTQVGAKQHDRLIDCKEKTTNYSEVFVRLSVKGVGRKVFHEVWRVVVVRLSVLEDSQCLG